MFIKLSKLFETYIVALRYLHSCSATLLNITSFMTKHGENIYAILKFTVWTYMISFCRKEYTEYKLSPFMFWYPTKYYEFHDETRRDEIYHDEIDGVNIYDIFL